MLCVCLLREAARPPKPSARQSPHPLLCSRPCTASAVLQYKWALWQVDDSGTSVTIAAVGEKDSTYEDFLAAFPDTDCRYGGTLIG